EATSIVGQTQYELSKDEKTEARPVSRWRPEPGRRIQWRNYLDHGDPIAYRLRATAEWMRKNGWCDVFEFDKLDPKDKDPGRHEICFSRYLFPGKAHVDYWEDKEVFGHFLETVVGSDVRGSYEAPPRSRWWVGLFSRVVPYALPAGLIVTAVYILFHA